MLTIPTTIKENILKMNGLELYSKVLIVEELNKRAETVLICKDFQTGACRYADNCKFKHENKKVRKNM